MNDKTHNERRLTLSEVLDLLLADGLVVAEDVEALKEERKRYKEKAHPLVVIADQKWRNAKLPARLLTIEVLSEWLGDQVSCRICTLIP